ncbi:DnaJ-class molecular chaperone [Pararhizobium capsulatum DSM 1112]|uniref:DnaJ-class molecular chaperone n=1 Tax=Pararhizobium capsulatum DSM 1112 TaxID=1121113 RepID=A0ABU0BSB8_9HYPH|nr:DnaJ C-terminal domain-containing protein [Pararhizobium capsulatum]MDQ0320541.1 DnaJ-class molecular chaperone [Pararhizobium capsulatum DSM 1112]
MSRNLYDVLGVTRDASQKDIQSAYRKLAKKYHPDLNSGDKQAEEQFKATSSAYALLGDEDKRGRYDRGEIDDTGAEAAPRNFYRDYAGNAETAGRYESAGGFADFGDLGGAEDIFSTFFSQRGRSQSQGPMRGRDQHFSMEIDLLDAVNGAKRQITLPEGGSLDLSIPAGTRDGQTLRLRGKGNRGHNGAPAGDALIDIHVRPHPLFKLDVDDVRYDVPISLSEAVLGAKIKVPTMDGAVNVSIGPNSNTGKTLRLKGKGLHKRDGGHGDAYVTLKIVLPGEPDAKLTAFVEEWSKDRNDDPRRGMGGGL